MVHEVKYKRIVPEAKLPTLATNGASGYDVYLLTVLDRETKAVISNLELPAEILPGESVLFGTGIALEIPPYLHAAVLSRTGLAVKHNIEVGYSGAIIDSDYRGEITILLRKLGKKMFKVEKFTRGAQLVFQHRLLAAWIEADELSKTARGVGSHGSSGLY